MHGKIYRHKYGNKKITARFLTHHTHPSNTMAEIFFLVSKVFNSQISENLNSTEVIWHRILMILQQARSPPLKFLRYWLLIAPRIFHHLQFDGSILQLFISIILLFYLEPLQKQHQIHDLHNTDMSDLRFVTLGGEPKPQGGCYGRVPSII